MTRYVITPDTALRLAQDETVTGDGCQLLAPTLLADRILQAAAWKVADQLGWPDTLDAEYVALTQLQADALITLDGQLALAARAWSLLHRSKRSTDPPAVGVRAVPGSQCQ